MALCTSNQQSDSILQQFCVIFKKKIVIRNHPDDYKWVKFGPKHNYVCLTNSMFGLFMGSWSSYPFGLKCLGKIMVYLMSFLLHLCDWSVSYCASLEAWNWVLAGQHLNASHPRPSVWPNKNVKKMSGNNFWTTLNCHITSTIRAFDLIPKLRAKPEYQLSSGT